MPRPQKYADPRNRILARARSLVVRKGFDKVSLRAIAKASGFSPASLYEYFPSREAILGELAARANQALCNALTNAAAGQDVLPALEAVGRAYVSFARDQEEDFMLLFRRSVSKRRALTEEVPEGSAYQVVLDLFDRGIGSGELCAGGLRDAEGCAYAFWSLVHGQASLQLTTLRKFDADFAELDRAAVKVQLEALKT